MANMTDRVCKNCEKDFTWAPAAVSTNGPSRCGKCRSELKHLRAFMKGNLGCLKQEEGEDS